MNLQALIQKMDQNNIGVSEEYKNNLKAFLENAKKLNYGDRYLLCFDLKNNENKQYVLGVTGNGFTLDFKQ